ncbi:MAG: SDR family oxidoreductase [Deltaproteobacteria bacterium]|nr:SDR family oxidoreductase [Deltaproteobacteria bacterium]
MKLKGKVAIITGGNDGIGRVIALTFVEEGARVSICGRRKEKLKEAEEEIKSRGGEVLSLVTDISREEEVESMVAKTVDRFGTLDILVNNASREGPTSPIHEMSGDDWRAVIGTNLNGLFYCTKYALRVMIPRRSGNILNIGSIAGVYAYPLRTPYNATKWAIGGVTQTIAAEVGQYNIRCNCLSPGPTEGERAYKVIRKRAQATNKSFEEMKRFYEDQIPIKRFITPQEVARVAVFLVSDDSSGVTAQHFCVSGGIEVL